MLKILAAVAALSIGASAVAAQTTTPTPTPAPASTLPNMAQCAAGWTDGMAWTKADFEAACLKVRAGGKL